MELQALREQADAMAFVMSGKGDTLKTLRERDVIKHQIAKGYSVYANAARQFWNWGMQDETIHSMLRDKIAGYDSFESDGHCEQLYFFTLSQIPRDNDKPRRVLEVGCGAGGGLNFLSRIESGSEFVGVDLAETAIEHANARFARSGMLTYKYGDAENLPFADGEFDAVINVESSHNYPSFETFMREVARVLKPGGYFSLVDIFTTPRCAEFKRLVATDSNGLNWLHERDISDPVKAAIRKRMQPGSSFRRNLRRVWRIPLCYVAVPIMLRAYGAYFVSQGNALTRRLRFHRRNGFRSVAGVTSYRHALAIKPR